jgi:ankyrin repeat protein
MSRSATDDAEASQPQLFDKANVSGNSQHEPMPTAYARSLVKIYSRCNHTKDRPQRLEIALERLQEEHPDLPSTFDLTTWKDEGMGYTALHWAVYYSRHQMVKVLVDGGCNVNTRDWGRETPLFIACAKGDLLMVQKLVGLGAWVSVRSKHHESPLIVAAREGSPKVIQYLLRNGALAQLAWSVYWHAGMAGNVKAIEVGPHIHVPPDTSSCT